MRRRIRSNLRETRSRRSRLRVPHQVPLRVAQARAWRGWKARPVAGAWTSLMAGGPRATGSRGSCSARATRPAVSSVDVSREDVLGRWKNAGPAPGRVEAKLVTWADAQTLDKASGLNPLNRDPDSLVWIVAVSAVGGEPGFSLPTRGGRL